MCFNDKLAIVTFPPKLSNSYLISFFDMISISENQILFHAPLAQTFWELVYKLLKTPLNQAVIYISLGNPAILCDLFHRFLLIDPLIHVILYMVFQ